MYELVYFLDREFFNWLNGWAASSPAMSGTAVFLAVYLWYLVMAAVVFIVAFSFLPSLRKYLKRNCEFFFFTFASAFAARFVFTELIRFFYNRPRPFDLPAEVLTKAGVEPVRQLIAHASDGSFPSGHAALSFAVATAVAFYYPRTSILFFVAAFVIGLGRVAAGVHYPIDILGGAVVGVMTAWLLRLLKDKFFGKKTGA
ncbi:MAG: phosphatase PAP2 family protein [Candidatus Sungbacteria bacterium]|nr:phosphatase PAP2 family protein [Candidatus Sungbacteria bacterium]